MRTIADVAFGGRRLVLKLRVRKWICREASCPQHIFAERFPEFVQRYARMTDQLIKAHQALGVTTNGAGSPRPLACLPLPKPSFVASCSLPFVVGSSKTTNACRKGSKCWIYTSKIRMLLRRLTRTPS
nr:hypothetical protein [Ktedonospora formicarum]